MRLNEQYIPIHRLLGWIMGWDPKWVTGPPRTDLHMTTSLVWFNDPGYQEKSDFGPWLKSFKNIPPQNTVCIKLSKESGGLWA